MNQLTNQELIQELEKRIKIILLTFFKSEMSNLRLPYFVLE